MSFSNCSPIWGLLGCFLVQLFLLKHVAEGSVEGNSEQTVDLMVLCYSDDFVAIRTGTKSDFELA